MKNPILSNINWLILYLLWWVLPGSIHSFVLIKAFSFNGSLVLADAFVSFAILSVFGLSLWYMVRFSSFDIENRQKTIQGILISMTIIFILWLSISYLIISIFYENFYNLFSTTILWRALIYVPVYMLILSMYYLLSSQEKIRDHEKTESDLQITLRETELKALKAQINPHFLFNSLNSASSLTIYDPAKAREMIIMISEFFRSSLIMGKKPMNTVAEEMNHALLYLEIEKARFGEKIAVEYNHCDGCDKVVLPSLLLQPLVENAVKHGVYESEIPITISFDFEIKGAVLSITIKNNLDINAGGATKGTGTGLRNVEDRIRLNYANLGSINIEKAKDNFKVIIRIPVKISDDE